MLAGHEGPISGLMFSPCRPLLVSGSWDKTVRLWNMFDSKVSWETLNLGSDGVYVFFFFFFPYLTQKLVWINYTGSRTLVSYGNSKKKNYFASVFKQFRI